MVALFTANIIKPSAIGSKVPRWPTFLKENFFFENDINENYDQFCSRLKDKSILLSKIKIILFIYQYDEFNHFLKDEPAKVEIDFDALERFKELDKQYKKTAS